MQKQPSKGANKVELLKACNPESLLELQADTHNSTTVKASAAN